MGRGAAAVTPYSLASLPSLRGLHRTRPSKSPLVHDEHGVAIGAATRIGLLHRLRGAPSQDRNAVLAHKEHATAMLAVFAGHGKHGAQLAEMAAAILSRHVRTCLFPKERGANWKEGCSSASYGSGGSSTWSGESGGRDLFWATSLERVIDDGFVDASIAIDGTRWSRNSGTTAMLCLVRKGRLVVGTCGNSCVMVAFKKGGLNRLKLMSELHETADMEERERVIRFGGMIQEGGVVTDQEERCTLAVTRSLGDLEMRSAGVCQIPTIRSFDLGAKDTHLIVSSQPLWSGESRFAPQRLADVVGRGKWTCAVDLAEALMRVAFGGSGPTCDATILCARLR